jgi:hypothetical protein
MFEPFRGSSGSGFTTAVGRIPMAAEMFYRRQQFVSIPSIGAHGVMLFSEFAVSL